MVAAAGDIACESSGKVTPTTCQQAATSALLDDVQLAGVLTLGDEQYVTGRLSQFKKVYDPTWGRYLSITHATPGNHEYASPKQLEGYFEYFGKAAGGNPSRPYYSFDIGTWHIIALDTGCEHVGGCSADSPQGRWLAADLAAHPARCTLAMWHEPLFSSGGHGNNRYAKPFWDALYEAGAEIVLNGHDHNYERFALQTPEGAADPSRGIREFVVGTGGKSLRPIRERKPNSQASAEAFGVLFLTLRPTGYSWRFQSIPGFSFSDSGSGICH